MYCKRAIDLVPTNEGKYNPIKDPSENVCINITSEAEAKVAIKKILTNIMKAGTEWGEENLPAKAHIVLSLEIVKKGQAVAKVDIIRLCGCEHARAGGGDFHSSEGDKQFSKASFSAISNYVVESGLKAKLKGTEEKASALIGNVIMNKILQKSVASNKSIAFVCCTGLYQQQYPNIFPTMKFASKLRECICRGADKRKDSNSRSDIKRQGDAADDTLARLKEEIEELRDKSAKGENVGKALEMKEKHLQRLLAQVELQMKGKDNASLMGKRQELIRLRACVNDMKRTQLVIPLDPLSRQSAIKKAATTAEKKAVPAEEKANVTDVLGNIDKMLPEESPSVSPILTPQRPIFAGEPENSISAYTPHPPKSLESNSYLGMWGFADQLENKKPPKEYENRIKQLEEVVSELKKGIGNSASKNDQTTEEEMKKYLHEERAKHEDTVKMVLELKKEVQRNKEELSKSNPETTPYNSCSLSTIEKAHAEEIRRLNEQLAKMKEMVDKDTEAIREINEQKKKLLTEVEQLKENVTHGKSEISPEREENERIRMLEEMVQNQQAELADGIERINALQEENAELKENIRTSRIKTPPRVYEVVQEFSPRFDNKVICTQRLIPKILGIGFVGEKI
eukprot:TRINITY_DN2413_c2_g1_i1.p1 TRINITY_DN2413_c2_g1~~TRINITY_DN2413_c2_g1_i1.p1  ORF type:complete len:626 (+),score=105.29 TRINITY_DN2413_c2_g1_i1:771-2648(+)